MQTVVPSPSTTMKSVRPKLMPTLVCFTLVGLLAAFLPYPGFENQVTVVDTTPRK